MVNDACGFHCHSLTRVQKMAESESFNTLLMSMHGPCARMTLIAISSLAVFTLVMDSSCIEYCRPCGSSKKVRAAPFGFAW